MFKKKSATSIPPRPPPPDANHILEDLSVASSNDPLFSLGIKSKHASTMYSEECTKGAVDSQTPHTDEMKKESEDAYIQVKNFVETNLKLQEVMNLLREKNDSLQISDLELKGLAEDIRKQALEALK